MTREEAIEYLDGMKIVIPICNELKELTDERNTAIDMAIEALSDDALLGDECDHCVYKWGTKGGDDE